MKNVLVISSTPRVEGNSEIIAKEFARGAEKAGNHVDFVTLRDYKLNYCMGCDACRKLGKCVHKDGMEELHDKLRKADVIMLATPVYFYSMSGQLKVFIDRLYFMYREISADIYLAATMWDPNEENMEATMEAIRGCTRDCMRNCTEKGAIYGAGLGERKEAYNNQAYLTQAYNYGKNC